MDGLIFIRGTRNSVMKGILYGSRPFFSWAIVKEGLRVRNR